MRSATKWLLMLTGTLLSSSSFAETLPPPDLATRRADTDVSAPSDEPARPMELEGVIDPPIGNRSVDENSVVNDSLEEDTAQQGPAEDAAPVQERDQLARPGFVLEDFRIQMREEPWLLSDEQLRDAGWEFRDQSFRRGSPLAGLAALTIGIPFHGVGHLLVGDNDSMFRLLISEVLALGVAGVGTIMRDAAPHRNGVWASGSALQVAGLSAFAAGWLTDVVGSFKGTTVPLPRNSANLKGMAVDLHYTVLFSNEVEVTSVGVVGFQWLGERFSLRPVFAFGPGEGYYRGDLLGEYRHPFWRSSQSYFSVWGEIGEEIFGQSDWGREVALFGLGVSVDMGDLLEHTRGLVWKLRAGTGVQSFHYSSQQHRRFLPGNVRLLVPVETSIAMNLNRGLNVELGYRHRPDELAGTVARFGGTLYQQFTVLPINRLGIAMRLEQGAYLRLWVGVRYFITTPKL